MDRRKNFCESFNKIFNLLKEFLSAVQLERSSKEGNITSYRQGRQPARKGAAMKGIVGNYHLYENKFINFRDKLAQL